MSNIQPQTTLNIDLADTALRLYDERCSDGVMDAREMRETRHELELMVMMARNIDISFRFGFQAFRSGFEEAGDKNLQPAMEAYERDQEALLMRQAATHQYNIIDFVQAKLRVEAQKKRATLIGSDPLNAA